MKPAALVATLFLVIVAVAHLFRIVYQVPVTAGPWTIPMWASVLAIVGPLALAFWLWKEQHK